MPSLIDPDARLRESVLAAASEFGAGTSYPVRWYITDIDPLALTDPDAFRGYVDRVLRDPDERRDGAPEPEVLCPSPLGRGRD
jgi:hypothetical protein